jgi:hypothetical protein
MATVENGQVLDRADILYVLGEAILVMIVNPQPWPDWKSFNPNWVLPDMNAMLEAKEDL